MNNQGNIRVLIAEDDYLVCQVIKALLKELKYTVVGEAADGLEAVEMTHALQPDVILMDIGMPGMDGIEAARLIQERHPTPVVVLTAYEMERLAREASAAGAGAYLVKPPNARKVERAVTIAMARFDDMMALRQSNHHLEEALTELQETQETMLQQARLAAVGQLSVGIAHEFNNILSSVTLYTEMSLNASELTPQVRKRLEVIARQANRAAALVQQIVDFGCRAVLQREDLGLFPFMVRLTGRLERTLPENIHLNLECATEELQVNADPARLQQAIMNLVDNARHAMFPTGGGELRVALSKRPKMDKIRCVTCGRIVTGEEWASISVTDTGAGIPPDVLPRIFEPFFTTRAPLGSGLGLPQAYGIAKQHGGHIGVETQEGEGSTFTLYLPALPALEPEALPAPPVLARMARGNGETILIVEDFLALRQALVDSLEMLNYRTLEAGDGQEALSIFEQHSDEIVLVLSDFAMPKMSGLTLCRELKRRYPAVLAVILTGHPLAERSNNSKDLESAGVVGWVQKPMDLEQLAGAVAQAVAG